MKLQCLHERLQSNSSTERNKATPLVDGNQRFHLRRAYRNTSGNISNPMPMPYALCEQISVFSFVTTHMSTAWSPRPPRPRSCTVPVHSKQTPRHPIEKLRADKLLLQASGNLLQAQSTAALLQPRPYQIGKTKSTVKVGLLK